MPPAPLRLLVVAPLAAALLGGSLGTSAAQGPTPTQGSDGIGDSYYPLDGNGGIDVLSYRIRDRWRFARARLTGSTTLRLQATQDLSRFDLDLLLDVDEVTVDGVAATFSKPGNHEVEITPATPVASGQVVTVVVRYSGHPRDESYLGESNWLANGHEVVAINQPHMAPWWFASNDHPADKARMDVAITVGRHKRVFAGGHRVSRVVHDRLATTRWRAGEPMATYLAFFAAGDFEAEHGVSHGLPWLTAVSTDVPRDRRTGVLRLLRRSPSIVRQLGADLGPYPFGTVGGLVTGLPLGFSLENQTRPTYDAGDIGPHSIGLVVHELAHQWFGDSVAVDRWKEIWLNEGSATFMERRWAETHGGVPASSWLRSMYDTLPADAQFWKQRIGDPGAAIDNLFSTPVYVRGGMTLQALRNRIGNRDFWQLVRTWLAERAGGNGNTAQFEALAEQVSGEELSAFFDAWLYTGAKPADTAANGLGGSSVGRSASPRPRTLGR